MKWMILPLRRYAEFSGRSRRLEFWMFALFTIICYLVVFAISSALGFSFTNVVASSAGGSVAFYGSFFSGNGILFVILWAALLLPTIAVSVRRLHDRDMSGWWYLPVIALAWVPLIGGLIGLAFLVVTLLRGTPGPNRFGPDPKDPLAIDVFA
jgi:uncharacterized membrane protein YhaH (DUF805 family)